MKDRKSYQPPPACPDSIPEAHYPKRFTPADLPIGQSVWYRNERYYVEQCPRSWVDGTSVRIGDVRFDPTRPERLTNKRNTFCVHADLLELAPVTKNKFGRQPTKAAVDRRQRMRTEGTRDNGDEVAVMLRACKSLDDVYKAAAKFLSKEETELRKKYKHLDNGRQRMCLGNLMRGEAKRRTK